MSGDSGLPRAALENTEPLAEAGPEPETVTTPPVSPVIPATPGIPGHQPI